MLEVKFEELDNFEDKMLKYAVIVSNYNGAWVYCKHKNRTTWEVPGGHIEIGELPLEAAKRELQEETGAIEFDFKPICLYSVANEAEYSLLCYAKIKKLGEMPDFEIERIGFFVNEPENLTYPDIQPKLFEKVKSVIHVE